MTAAHLWPPSRLGSGGGENRPVAWHGEFVTLGWLWTGNGFTTPGVPDYKHRFRDAL